MKLHWQETVLRPYGKYKLVKREATLVFIENKSGYITPEPHPLVEGYNPKTYGWINYTVAILRVKGKPGVYSGVSRFSASEGETFSYSKGRKLALGRALKQAVPLAHNRAKAWYSYRLQTEMEMVKKEEAREKERVATAQHEARKEAFNSAVADYVRNSNPFPEEGGAIEDAANYSHGSLCKGDCCYDCVGGEWVPVKEGGTTEDAKPKPTEGS